MPLPLPSPQRPAPFSAPPPASAGFRSTLRWWGAGLLLLSLLLWGHSLRAQTTFDYTGGTQTYTMPAGVVRLNVAASGSTGALNNGYYSRGAAWMPR